MNDDFKFHLVEWDKVCSPIDEGGLGIRNMRWFNQALLGKWLWRFAHEEGAWWRSVLVAKYGSVWGGWRSGVISGSHGVGLWKFICMGWLNFRKFFKYDPGDGSKIRFWDDVWCGDRALKEVFPDLFSIASFKKASIAAQVCHKPGSFINNLDPKPSCTTARKPQSPGSLQIRNQWSGSTKTLPYHIQDRRPVQQDGQVGESSAMGAARSTGAMGMTIAGESSGERSVAVGALTEDRLGSTGESDVAGEHIGGTGLPEKRSTASGAPDSEDAEGLGHLIPSPTLLLSTIPESSDLDNASTPPVKRYKGMSDCIELADEGEINICMPEKQTKQMKVFQRRESPSAKVTKSWVAERVVWNGDHEIAATGKNLNVCLDSVGQTDCVDTDPGVQELGCLGGMGIQEEENTIIEGSISQSNTEGFPEAFEEQELDLGSPASKDLKWAWAVKGTAGLSCGGQERKLFQVFGQIVADKYGGGTSYPTGMEADDNRGMGDEDIPYEA
jgi:hypothetical protein